MFDCKLESIEYRHGDARLESLFTRYVKVVIDPPDDLDFEMKLRYGNVKYKVMRVLHYMRYTGKTEWGGILRVMEPRDVYEIGIYGEDK